MEQDVAKAISEIQSANTLAYALMLRAVCSQTPRDSRLALLEHLTKELDAAVAQGGPGTAYTKTLAAYQRAAETVSDGARGPR